MKTTGLRNIKNRFTSPSDAMQQLMRMRTSELLYDYAESAMNAFCDNHAFCEDVLCELIKRAPNRVVDWTSETFVRVLDPLYYRIRSSSRFEGKKEDEDDPGFENVVRAYEEFANQR